MTRAALVLVSVLLTSTAHGQDPDVGVDEQVGAAVPRDIALIDGAGRRISFGDLLGQRPLVLILAYSRCTALCSLVLRGAANAVRATSLVPGRDFDLVTVSFDPSETASTAASRQRNYLAAIDARDEHAWRFLVAPEDSIRALARSVGVRYRYDARTGQYAHPSVMIALSAEGRVRSYLYGITPSGRELDAALAGIGSSSGSWLRCFVFDPASRRYGWVIRAMLRLGALTTLLAVAALVLRAVHRRVA